MTYEEHRRSTRADLGYRRTVCAHCGADWPCPEAVRARCERRMEADREEPCSCGWHEPPPPRGEDELRESQLERRRERADEDERRIDERRLG